MVLINFYFLSDLEQKKSRMERCGDLGGQLTGPLFPIQGCKKCKFKQSLNKPAL